MKQIIFVVCLVFALAVPMSAQQLVLGNPSNATNDTANSNNFLVVRPEFILSYNRSRGTANWVAWHLTKSDIGSIRKDAFHGDPLLPKDWRVSGSTWSPFQRGHMCPSKDRSTTLAINRETFVMSNMQPQTKELNEDTWGNLEDETRARVINEGKEAYIYAGCYGSKGRVKNIAKRVTVPTHCFKIVVLLPENVTGDVLLSITVRGLQSNKVLVNIRPPP